MKNHKPQKLTYTVQEVSMLLGMSTATCYELIDNDEIPSFKIGKRIFVLKDHFHKWLEQKNK